MIEPEYPENERERQREVEKYKILDTFPEESYDNLTAVMAYICDVPISLVSILDKDRNFLKSHHGVPFYEDPRARSFCGHTILQDSNLMVVEDATKDERFCDNPLVTELGVRFYAGTPLISPNGYKLGTLCVFDLKPNKLSQIQKDTLIKMSKQVMTMMEHHLQKLRLEETKERLERRNSELKKFAALVSHDLKSPLSNIQGLIEIVSLSLDGQLDDETAQHLDLIKQSTASLSSYVDGILSFYKSDELLKGNQQNTTVEELFSELKRVYSGEDNVEFDFNSSLKEIHVNQGVLMQILVNLISNGLKYNHSDKRSIKVLVDSKDGLYRFVVEDNGVGMTDEEIAKAFELFETNNKKDRTGKLGTGIGLSTVKKLITSLGGEIQIDSQKDGGTSVEFTIP